MVASVQIAIESEREALDFCLFGYCLFLLSMLLGSDQ